MRHAKIRGLADLKEVVIVPLIRASAKGHPEAPFVAGYGRVFSASPMSGLPTPQE